MLSGWVCGWVSHSTDGSWYNNATVLCVRGAEFRLMRSVIIVGVGGLEGETSVIVVK